MHRKTKRWILWVGKLFVLVIYLVLLAYSVIVGMAFVLQLLGANPTSDFADWVYRAAESITEPFRGIFPTTQVSTRSTFNASWLFALMIYLVVAVMLHGVIDWITRRISGIDRAEEHERMMAALDAQQESTRSALGYDPARRPRRQRPRRRPGRTGPTRRPTPCPRPPRP